MKLNSPDKESAFEWDDLEWQKGEEWCKIIPYTAEIVMRGRDQSVDLDSLNITNGTAIVVVTFADAFGNDQTGTQHFAGTVSAIAGFDMHRVLSK